MAFNFPLDLYFQVQQQKNQNQQDMNQNLAGIGQGLGQGLGAIGQAVKQRQQKQLIDQVIQLMKNQGVPQQGPAVPKGGVSQSMVVPPNQPMSASPSNIGQDVSMQPSIPPPSSPPSSGMGVPPADNTQQIQALLMKLDPQGMIKSMMDKQNVDPIDRAYKQALTGQAQAETEAKLRPPKPAMEWSSYPGTMDGKALEINKSTGEVRPVGMAGKYTPQAGMGSAMANVRQHQFTLQDLPSNQGPSTAGGAAYQVKVAARQGKNLIAKTGSSQRLGLAQGDLARAVLRNSPTDEAMRNANFSENLVNRWNQMKQNLTSDPTAINNPKIRREIYDIFDEMDKSSTPFIQNQLDDMADAGFPVTPATRKRQLGLNLPDVQFVDDPQNNLGRGTVPSVGGTFQGGKVLKVETYTGG